MLVCRVNLSVILILAYSVRITAISTWAGTNFLLAFPQLVKDTKHITFYFVTISNNVVTISISMPWYKAQTPVENKNITRSVVGTFTVNNVFNSGVETGTRFTFMFVASEQIGISVLLMDDLESTESLNALPVAGWGKIYLVATRRTLPSVQIVTAEGPNNIAVTLRQSYPKNLNIVYNGQVKLDGSVLDVQLQALEAFSIAECNVADKNGKGGLTGSRIEASHPVGVIAGNCHAEVERLICNTTTAGSGQSDGGYLAEMLLPFESYGKEFITISYQGRLTPLMFMVVAAEKNTEVYLSKDDSGAYETVVLAKEGDLREFYTGIGVITFTSNKGVLAVMYMRSRCEAKQGLKENGDPAMCILVPNVLFHDTYIWSSPETETIKPSHYMTIVIAEVDIKHLTFDGKPIQDPQPITWMTVLGKTTWRVGGKSISRGIHDIHGKETIKFGCYVYGFGEKFAYMHPAGYAISPINMPCSKSIRTMKPGDLIDNDCDGRVDEETKNLYDDDYDSQIDEDLGNPKRYDGHYSEWGSWVCSSNCSDKRLIKNRKCDNPSPQNGGYPCEGLKFEYKAGNCYSKPSDCPTGCGVGSWGHGCLEDCSNCETDCDKFTGECTICKNGYQFPLFSCKKPCDSYHYGFDCRESCKEKCRGQDCIDRTTGACPGANANLLPLLSLLALIPLGLLCFFWHRQNRIESEDFDDFTTVTSYETDVDPGDVD